MATPTITPTPSVASAAPAAPVSAPSTPAVSTPVSTPESPQSWESKLAADVTKVMSEPVDDDTVVEGDATPAAEAAPSEETPAVEAAPAEDEAAAEAVEAAPVEAPAEDDIKFEIDSGEEVGPDALSKFLNENVSAKEALDANPELKNSLFAALRRDTENREIRQLIPDMETAKTVTSAAATFQSIDNKFLEATTPEGAD